MERNLEVTLISGKGLQKVNLITKMDVYAVAEISGGPKGSKQKTYVDKDGDSNPSWNFPIKFTLDESAIQQNRLMLVVKLKAEGMLGNKEIGEVHVPIKELLDGARTDASMKVVSYQVRKPSGKPKGELYFSYKFGEVVEKAKGYGKIGDEELVTGYPMAGPSSGYPRNPPPPTAPYSPPQVGGYYPPPFAGYPPQQQVQQPQKKKNKFDLGSAAELLVEALGALVLGDIVSNAAASSGCEGSSGGSSGDGSGSGGSSDNGSGSDGSSGDGGVSGGGGSNGGGSGGGGSDGGGGSSSGGGGGGGGGSDGGGSDGGGSDGGGGSSSGGAGSDGGGSGCGGGCGGD